jgi:hypothetical protein
MRKPYVASAPCLRKSLKKKQIARRRRSVSGNSRAPRNDNVEAAAREPLRYGFGAVRVGALLGRVRLHLQTERFLAVHRGDAMWENGCLHASLALGEIVSRMTDGEMNAPLAFCERQKPRDSARAFGARQPSDACDAGLERGAP